MHSLVIGTSKSKNEDAYYVEAKDKFWLSLFKSGYTEIQLRPEDYRELISKGIGFAELAFHHQFTGDDEYDTPFTQDKQLNNEIEVVKRGIPELNKFIREKRVKNLVFNGKTALSCFLEFHETGTIEAINSSYLRSKTFSYGKCLQWEGLDVYLMPNLSAAAGKEWKTNNGLEHWMSLWNILKSQNTSPSPPSKKSGEQHTMQKKSQLTTQQKVFVGLFLFVFSTIMILVYLLLIKDTIHK